MKTFSRLTFLMTMTVAIVGCSKDDDAPETSIVNNNLSVTIPNVPAEVVNVKLFVDCTIEGEWIWDKDTQTLRLETTFIEGEEIASGNYSGGKLTMNLPATVDNRYLEPMIENIEAPVGMSVSNRDCKGIGGCLVGYDKDGNALGWFFYGKFDEENEEVLAAGICYVDSDAIITGETPFGELIKGTATYDCNFKKGWNFLYIIFSFDEEKGLLTKTTTSNPGGLIWIFAEFVNS